MKTPYTNRLRHGMPKSRNEQQALYDGIVRGMLFAGGLFGVLMVASQFFIWAHELASPKAAQRIVIAEASQECVIEFRKAQRPCKGRE